MTTPTNSQLLSEAQKYIPGGVNSPVRAFGPVGIEPRFIARAAGSHIWDVQGKEYIDYVGSWGPLILGHAHPQVVEAICQAAGRGTSFGAPTAAEVELAQLVCGRVGSVHIIRVDLRLSVVCRDNWPQHAVKPRLNSDDSFLRGAKTGWISRETNRL